MKLLFLQNLITTPTTQKKRREYAPRAPVATPKTHIRKHTEINHIVIIIISVDIKETIKIVEEVKEGIAEFKGIPKERSS